MARHTLALRELLSSLSLAQRTEVLDLGSASGGNVGFFAKYSCRLFIADLYQTLRQAHRRIPLEADALDKVMQEHLPSGSFELILVWDLLNYFDAPQLEVVGRHLDRLAAEDCRVLALINTRKQIPDRPLQYEIADTETLIYRGNTSLQRPGPGYKEPELARCLGSFAVETSFLLRHGVQEYILAHKPTDEPEEATDSTD